jgi:hypothetical protein
LHNQYDVKSNGSGQPLDGLRPSFDRETAVRFLTAATGEDAILFDHMSNDHLAAMVNAYNEPTSHKPSVKSKAHNDQQPSAQNKPKTRGGQKRHLAPLDQKGMAAAIADMGHLYHTPADIVVLCPSLSGLAKAVYWYLETQCYPGTRDKSKKWFVVPPRWNLIIERKTIGDMFAVPDDRVTELIGELVAHGLVTKKPTKKNGKNLPNEYQLPLRRMLIEKRIEEEKKLKETHTL